MNLSINSYGINLGNAHQTSPFIKNNEQAAKLIVNGKAIDLKRNEENIPDYLQKIREQNEQLKDEQIIAKAESGSDLSPEELAYIKEKNPELYQQIMQEIRFQKQFEQQLKSCKDKKQAQALYLNTQLAIGKMCGIKSSSTTGATSSDSKKYNRMMNRIQKSYAKYLSGKLNDDSNTSSQPTIKDATATVIAAVNKDKKDKDKHSAIGSTYNRTQEPSTNFDSGNIYDSQV